MGRCAECTPARGLSRRRLRRREVHDAFLADAKEVLRMERERRVAHAAIALVLPPLRDRSAGRVADRDSSLERDVERDHKGLLWVVSCCQ